MSRARRETAAALGEVVSLKRSIPRIEVDGQGDAGRGDLQVNPADGRSACTASHGGAALTEFGHLVETYQPPPRSEEVRREESNKTSTALARKLGRVFPPKKEKGNENRDLGVSKVREDGKTSKNEQEKKAERE